MIITNQEKQILQKHYAERIKSRAAALKEAIQQDEQDVLANNLLNIKEDSKRICQIQNAWRCDTTVGASRDTITFDEAKKLGQEVENGHKKGF